MNRSIPLLLALISMACIGHAQKESSWHIVADDIDPNNYYGITCGNGMIGLVSSPNPMKVDAVVLNGVYDYYQRGRVSNILKSFNHINMDISADGQMASSKNISHYKQVLDMKKAELITTFDIDGKLSVKHTMIALRHLPYTSLVQVEVTAKKDITVSARSYIEAPDHLGDVRNYFSHIDRPHVTIPLLTSVAHSPSGNTKVAASSSFLFEEAHGKEPTIVHEDWDFNRHWTKFNKTLKAGQTYRFALVASAVSSAHYQDPFNEAERLTIYAALEGVDRLLKRHRMAWEKLWESDIVVEGNIEDQRDIHSMLYHLYSFARKGTAFSMSPMGLSGLGYNGHVFWDTEIWMYPPLLILQPDIARSLLEYRFERLEMAKQNAFAHGYEGAMFPWESADDGSEDTPVWALTGPFQHHITGDIGWAFWKYYELTGDREFLRTRAYPVLKEVADFWTSRVERNGEGKYDINNVIGANEFEENIDNNAYTNGMAITVLNAATTAAERLGIEPNPDWAHVAANIPILTFPDGVTRENATYDGAIIKQGDANLLAYPMSIITDGERIRKDLKYYEPRLSPDGPAMSHSALGAIYGRLGEVEKAYELFKRSYMPNKVPPFDVLAETAGGTNPYFATGAGGTLQAVIFGIGGLDITEAGVRQLANRRLPDSWQKLQIKGVGKNEKEFTID
jgi:trehalose/maltose hydrolase-like predicted phosphorylase